MYYLESWTNYKISDVSISPTSATQHVGNSLDFVCTANGDSNITIKWKTTTVDKTILASEGNYNIEDGTITSTLTFDSLTTQDTDTYTCYVEFGDSESVEAEAQLAVNGMLIKTPPFQRLQNTKDIVLAL